jgi:integrase
MSQKPRSSGFETPSARLRKAIRFKPYTAVKIRRGLYLLYRRNEVIGAWIVRVCHQGKEWTKKIADANDRDPPNGVDILDYWQAIDECKRLADAGKPTGDNMVRAAINAYKTNLEDRDKDPDNVGRILAHLPDKLADKHVATLTDNDLKPFRDVLLANMKPNSAKRTIRAFNAALNFVADRDRLSRRPWNGPVLKIEDSSDPSNNIILDDPDRRAVRAAGHRHSEMFGLFVDILDETGARPSQVARLTADNVQANFIEPRTKECLPRLLMPVSRKGRGQKQISHRPVPISQDLANRLANLKARGGLLFKNSNGTSWFGTNLSALFARAVKGVKFNNADRVTMYALRHTSIVRQLMAGLPTAVVARLHDTSAAMIEKHYSAFIADVSDALARATLPKPTEIVSFDDRRTSVGA